jgi:hypothetical protein
MSIYAQDTRSPKRIRLNSITNVGTPQNAHHSQLKRATDGRFTPSPALTPDAKAKRRKAIEAAMAQADIENSFQHFGEPVTSSQGAFVEKLSLQKMGNETLLGSLIATQNTENSLIPEVIYFVR